MFKRVGAFVGGVVFVLSLCVLVTNWHSVLVSRLAVDYQGLCARQA